MPSWNPSTCNPSKPALPRKINRDRRRHLVDTVARIMREARDAGHVPTLLNLEAPMRHGLRSRLCLQGWRWADADAVAADIVAEAMKRNGAKRPTWLEGQPEWAQQGAGALIERTRCIRCHSPLPEGHTKFCSKLCVCAHHLRTTRLAAATEERAYDRAVRI